MTSTKSGRHSWSGRLALVLIGLVGIPAIAGASEARPPEGLLVPAVAILVSSSAPANDLYPWQICSGVLVAPSVVITAAHCVARLGRALDVVVGSASTCRGAPPSVDRHHVTSVRLDPRYDSASGRFDVAALTLRDPAQATPIKIAAASNTDQGTAFTFSWSPAGGGAAGCTLRRVGLQIASIRACRAEFGGAARAFDPASMRCARSEGADVCLGDSGAPMVVRDQSGEFRLAGIVSWGVACSDAHSTVYARVDVAASWHVPPAR